MILVRDQDRQVTRRDRLVALVLGLAAFAVLAAAQPTQGVSRDEAYYFKAGERYFTWFADLWQHVAAGKPGRSFTAGAVAKGFSYNHEHPPVAKVLFGISWRLFHRCHCHTHHATLGLTSHITAFRLPTCALTGLLVALIYLLGVRLSSRRAGVVAAVLTVAMPHAFFHAQIAAFDQPITVLWIATAYAYWRSLTSWRWAIVAGVALGFAMGTKHNVWFLPPLLGLHYLAAVVVSWRRGRPLPRPWWMVGMAVLGPLVFFVTWPWLWHSTIPRFLEYVRFHLHHVYYNIEYLGVNWNRPPFPWHYPLVVTALTVPVTTLVLALVGAGAVLRQRLGTWRRRRSAGAERGDHERRGPGAGPEDGRMKDGAIIAGPTGAVERASDGGPGAGRAPSPGPLRLPGLLLALLACFPLALFMTGRTPIFGGMKHFLPAMPILALLAGVGFEALARVLFPMTGTCGSATAAGAPGAGPVGVALPGCLGSFLTWLNATSRRRLVASATLGALLCLPAVVETRRSHPYGLSHYNLLAGGFAGGASLGMNRQFWGYSPRGLLSWLNEHVASGERLYPHDMNTDTIIYYKRDGLLRKDLADVWQLEEPGMRRSQWALVIHEKHFARYDPALWEIYGTLQPAQVLAAEGVPLVTVYHRPSRRKSR